MRTQLNCDQNCEIYNSVAIDTTVLLNYVYLHAYVIIL